jgi:hypothetical protein
MDGTDRQSVKPCMASNLSLVDNCGQILYVEHSPVDLLETEHFQDETRHPSGICRVIWGSYGREMFTQMALTVLYDMTPNWSLSGNNRLPLPLLSKLLWKIWQY